MKDSYNAFRRPARKGKRRIQMWLWGFISKRKGKFRKINMRRRIFYKGLCPGSTYSWNRRKKPLRGV